MSSQELSRLRLTVWIWLLIFLGVLAWSAIAPKDYFTWFLEVSPALVALPVLAATRRRFPLTPLLYGLILVHAIILMVGGHYTYAEVPLFDWLREPLGWQRNNYDKLGHLAQGVIPAMLAREILVRRDIVNGVAWRNFFIICIALAFSAFYELLEWWAALATGESAEAFLGIQGYTWDTQSDMLYALMGAVLALLTLSSLHDAQLRRLPASHAQSRSSRI
jgi:putative membrane protein